ncbi:MAG: hypothetical protein H5U40_07585, partial [Polyangiaceae bacterium]|nr:hypothetical protein [Polyangiaceae bacterium]
GDVISEVRLFCGVILEEWATASPELMRLVLLDGPPVETWFVEEIGRVVSPVLAQHIKDAELVTSLMLGTLLAAGRFRVTQPRQISTKRLADMVTAFCAGGISSDPSTPETKQRRKR